MNGESAGPGLIAKRFIETDFGTDHGKAVQAQVMVTLEVFKGLIVVCSNALGIPAEGLLRTLFDSSISAIILTKHPEKLAAFIRQGSFTHMRMMRSVQINSAVLRQHVDSVVANTEKQYKQLLPEFKNQEWHKLGTKEAFKEAEYEESFYDRYFRPASAYAHA